MARYVHETTEGATALRMGNQYAKNPAAGLLVKIEQRTTLAGKAILLTPDQVQQLRDDLTAWLEALS
jgi:hypothetical protein